MKSSTRRNVLLSSLVLGGSVLLGGVLDGRAEAQTAAPSESRIRTFGQILDRVEQNYAGKLESGDLVENALQGMLRTLDPHSNYLNRDAYTEMKDEQRGQFYGLGIQITKRGPDKPLTIIAPIDDTPASRAGLQAGDVIFKIEGDETIGMTVQQAVRRLKGERGTPVTITIQRSGDTEFFDVTLYRDAIPTKSLPLAYMLFPDTGFVRISNFTSTTGSELDAALKRLRADGMTRLILDLRSNPGGLLEQAVQVSEKFLPPGKMVVYTRGRVPGSDQDYLAGRGGERFDLPLIVLVDRHSASASEIVSGAIQDHDRGLVVGETTFGKGLVQRVIPLRDGGALALTTAKYYTPSGRLIQRDYTDMDDYFVHPEMEDEDEEGRVGVSPDATPELQPDKREIRHTDAGRTVYGGGGITPDYVVRAERASPVLSRLIRENLIFDFAVRWLGNHPDVPRDVVAGDAMLEDFRQFVRSKGTAVSDEEFKKDRDTIALTLAARIAAVKWGTEAESRILARRDPQVQKAITLWNEAAELARRGEEGRREKDRAAAELDRPQT
ncbi:MAG TPA: S41 family peptidase [Candidatus Polarisedimenticolaceae bacterium]|nr:S41 family peptidase [Candidatus Polarisedimenticolaceae bacterium]